MIQPSSSREFSPERQAAVDGLRAVIVAFEQFRMRSSEHYGITVAEAHALSYLLEAGRLTQVELAHKLGITSGGATAMIDRMETAGLARRTLDPHDRRRRLVEVDPRLDDIVAEGSARLMRVFRHMSQSQLKLLTDDLNELAVNLNREAENFTAGAA